ncbi:hypothetical protein [Comamonas terrigena]|uniref:hypothetical protein n=1 Tax=Comamonas terrigena TaxID=32013 RepID=UPI0028A1E7CF|nr:hypothetical protein [Comamonas terrigena]
MSFLKKLFGTHEKDMQEPQVAPGHKRISPPNSRPMFHIRYREDFGDMTRRDVFPIRMYATEEGIRAWCYLMGEIRLFKFAQMHGVHDIDSGRDIKVRGLWEWCGFNETDQVFPDEEQGASKQTSLPRNPEAAQYRLSIQARGQGHEEVDFSPVAWSSNRRDLGGLRLPAKEHFVVPFADVASALDLQSGEILDRVQLWNAVLEHRDDPVPWYVQWADQHLMVLCLIGFARQELRQFQTSMRSLVNEALVHAGHACVDDEGFKSIVQASKEGYNGVQRLERQVALLTSAERSACQKCACALLALKQQPQEAAYKVFQEG